MQRYVMRNYHFPEIVTLTPERNFIKLQIPALRSIDIMRLMGNVVYNM